MVRRLLQSLRSDNQLSVRYLLEWVVVQLMSMFPALLSHLYQLLEEVRKEREGLGGWE